MQVKILDCTLRDGGYINNWNFGYKNIKKIIRNLKLANIDIIELGYLNDLKNTDKNSTVYNDIENIKPLISNIRANYVAMIDYGKFDFEKLQNNQNIIKGLRICFKLNQKKEAINECKKLIKNGYDIYLQPTSLTDYTDEQILSLISDVNKLNIKAIYIVDTHGIMQKEDVYKYFYLFDNNVRRDISIGFHSHNNLQLSFSNAQALLNLNPKRNIFIDSSVFGMGRGAGNLCTELITQYLNTTYDYNYNLLPIMELVDECINPIFKEKPWGYSVAYYIASINKCHPNYSTYLVNKQTIGVKDINFIMKQIPESKKRNYDEKIINDLYIKYLSNKYDDSKDLKSLKESISGKDILLLAPGNNFYDEREKIVKYIKKYNPYIISIHFIPDIINVNASFFSNIKRFSNIAKNKLRNKEILFTSNIKIKENLKKYYKFNYINYLNDKEYTNDNATLMLISILKSIGINSISVAGFDGYDLSKSKNYYDENMKPNIDNMTFAKMNEEISEYLSNIDININFITTTNYKIKE